MQFSNDKDPQLYLEQMYTMLARYHKDDDRCMKVLQEKVANACEDLDWAVDNNPIMKVELQNLFTEMNKDLLNLHYLM